MQWNCDHLQSKIPEHLQFMEKHDIDVAALQETKLRAEDGEITIPGYNVIRKNRTSCNPSERGNTL